MLSVLTALVLAPLAWLHAAELSGTKPTVLRAVGPVRPGETVLLVGNHFIRASQKACTQLGVCRGIITSASGTCMALVKTSRNFVRHPGGRPEQS